MEAFQVTCVTKPNRTSAHEHITHIGSSEKNWCMTRELAIERIESKKEAYYTVDPTTGVKMYIGVVRGDGSKAPYLRTYANGKWNDNLLAQDECNGSCRLIG
jgi:hypothetical protein